MIKQAAWALALVGAVSLFVAADAQARADRPIPYGTLVPVKSSVRILPDVKPVGLDGKPTEILSEKQLAKLLGDDVLAKVKKDVDFSREKVVWVTWAGSSSSHLTFDVLEIAGRTRVSAWIASPPISLTDNRMLGALLVMPKDAVWEFGGGPFLRIPPGDAA